MQAEGTLQLIAELAIGFAGFTSVIAVFGNRGDSGGWSQREAAYLRLLVEYSIVTMLTAVLPLVLFGAGLAEHVAWRVAGGVKALQVAWYYLIRFRGLWGERSHFDSRWVGRLGVIGDFLFVVILAVSVALDWSAIAGVYVSFLYWLLLGMALTFVSAVSPLWHGRA